MRWAILIYLFALVAPGLADCTRERLKNVTNTYIAAQTSGKPRTLSSSAQYSENFDERNIRRGILSKPLRIDHNRSLHDTVACSTFTELIVANETHPYVLGTQIHLSEDGSDVERIGTIVTTTGDWLFNVTGTLYWSQQEDVASGWETIPEEERDTREVIKAAADAYLDVFSDSAVAVPWGTPCDRLEGGLYTGTGSEKDSCNVGVPSGVQIVNRKYVIDETVGSVDIFLNFGGKEGNPDSHNFRVVKGKIRYVHTMTYGQIED